MVVDPNASGTYEAIHINLSICQLWLIRFTERISCSLSSLNALWATKVGLGGLRGKPGGGLRPPPVCMLKNALADMH